MPRRGCTVRDRAVIFEEFGISAREIFVEINQKSELALLVVIAREGAIKVPVEGLPDIVAIEAKAFVERKQFPTRPVLREQTGRLLLTQTARKIE